MKTNTEQLAIALKYVGYGGSKFRKYCGLPSGAAWCDAYVTTIFAEAGNKSLFCDGTKQTYCPTTIKWCYKNLASVPPYLALPSDIIFFDWELNGTPNHIGFVRERKDCDSIYTVEGNTSGSRCAKKLRSTKYVQAVFRPHFEATFKIGALEIDGLYGYNSIAMTQKALKSKGLYSGDIDGILGQGTVKGIQRLCGATADGLWRKATSKKLQKFLGVKADGYFGINSVKALQRWLNKVTEGTPSVKKTNGDKVADMAEKYIGESKYVHGGANIEKGVDCTGFVREMYRLALGKKLKASLSSWGKSIGTDIRKAKRGDVITYRSCKTHKLKHHAIYVGNGKVVHASGSHPDHKKDIVKSGCNFDNLYIEGIRRPWK
jgi:cell wall-associated NlpC family hydrolase